MRMNKKVAALGAAGVIALAGAGLYAGVLSTTTEGTIGAGATDLQASCTDSATITAQEALWFEDSKLWEFGGVSVWVDSTTKCADQYVDLVVYNAEDGSVTRKAASRVKINDGQSEISVPLDDSLNAGASETGYKYGLVIQEFGN